MVRINNLKCRGLYSFSENIDLDFADRMLIVGPNNSGKSNLIRVIKLLVELFYNRKRLEDYEISAGSYDAVLEIDLIFSRKETEKILEFFSFHPDKQNNISEFYDYQNYETLLKIFDTLHVKILWRREAGGYGSEAYLELEFAKCGLKFFNEIHSGFKIFDKFPKEGENFGFNGTTYLSDVLSKISEDRESKDTVTKIFSEDIKSCIGITNLRVDRNHEYQNKAKQILVDLFSYLGISMESGQDVAFSEVLGTILKKGILFSSDNRGINSLTILDYAEMLKSGANDVSQQNFNSQLDTIALSKALELTDELNSDGSNLAVFLFSLKNSQKQNDRRKFEIIQKGFEDVFRSDNLRFDVILQYEISKRYRVGGKDGSKPKLPMIIIIDQKFNREVPLKQVGSGVSEIIYLLTVAYGVERSIILLDEPSVNLHPPLMRTLMRHLQNSDSNQFMIITHSSELASYQIFEAKSKIFYVRKNDQTTIIKTLDDKTQESFDKERTRLRHQIDSRIFFGKVIILTEGESDKNLLAGTAEYFETFKEVDITSNDVIITSVNGKNNFQKYLGLLKTFGIPYIVLADSDAKNLFPEYGTITKNGINGTNSIFIIENGDLECLMMEIDAIAYAKAKQTDGTSKPATAYYFVENVSNTNPKQLEPLREILRKAIALSH